MAKIVKVKMSRVQDGGRIQNSYPAEYDSKKIEIIAHEGISDVSKLYCIGVIADEDLAAFTASADIDEITQEDSIVLGDSWRPQVKKITDVNKVLAILDKVHNSVVLTSAEENAINPDHVESGINKSSIFNDLLNKAIGKMTNG